MSHLSSVSGLFGLGIGVAAAILIAGAQAFAEPQTLLDCQPDSGADQRVLVIQDGPSMILKELSMGGSWNRRPMTASEFTARSIKLRNDYGDNPVLSFDKGQGIWRLKSRTIDSEVVCY